MMRPVIRHVAATDSGAGGSMEALLPFLNLSSRTDFVLVVASLLAALRARGPYPSLAISGEQGSAIPTMTRLSFKQRVRCS
jgi:hypothetical protein